MKTIQRMKAAGLILAIIASMLFTSCDKRLHKEGSGVIQTVDRSLGSFTELDADGEFIIYSYVSSVPHVVITTDDNIMSEVHTFVQDGRLHIEMNKDYLNYDFTRMELHVYGPDYALVKLDGKIDFYSQDTITTPSMEFTHEGRGLSEIFFAGTHLSTKINGSADISVHGTSGDAVFTINGEGKIAALDLSCTDADANINGTGRIYVNCSEDLDATIDGSGHIYYLGSPSVSSHINGSGSVEQY